MLERVFNAMDRNGNVCEFELVLPNVNIENEGERQYKVAYSKSLVGGIFPREKLREIMRDHGMWTEEDESDMKKTVGRIALLQVELKNAEVEGNEDACSALAVDISQQRRRMWELFLIQQSVYMNSAEGVSEMIKTEAIMAACTRVKATGKRYWSDYVEYVQERDFNTKSTVYAKVIELQAGLLDQTRQGVLADYPEASYLKTTEEAMLDRDIEQQVLETIKERAEKALDDEGLEAEADPASGTN